MRVRLTALAVLIGIAVLVLGCTGAREVEEVGYVVAIGLDKAEEPDMIRVSYQLSTPTSGGGREWRQY